MLDKLSKELKQKHNCHTLIIYGSRADNTFNDESDIDILGFKENCEAYTDSRYWENLYLDVWIYPEKEIENTHNFIHLHNAKVLFEKNNIGTDLINKVKELLNKPNKREKKDIEHRITWFQKTLQRIEKGDLEANYRKNWVLLDILEMYFILNEKWFLGVKNSLKWLEKNDNEYFKVFQILYSSNPSYESIKESVNKVLRLYKD